MFEPVRPRASAVRPPLSDATHRINNNISHPGTKRNKTRETESCSSHRKSSASHTTTESVVPSRPHEPELKILDATSSTASSIMPTAPRQVRPRIVQNDPSKRASQVSQASTAASSNRSSGYNYKTQVGPWQLGKTLGKGSSARVRLCRHRFSGELAAVKIIPKKTAYLIQHGSLAALHKYDDSLPERIDGEMRVPLSIEREVAILKLVDHPNVMKVYDIWENRSEIYLVLEYVDKGDLFDFINSHGRLTEEGAMFYFRQIMSAMQYCHSFNICHRDLKPENILLNSKNEVKIADFGMAALHQSEGHRLETACGSPHYAAPELLKNRAYRGDRADIWSLGVILYAILAASLPFDDPDIRMLLAKTKKGQYEMPEFLSLEAKDLIRRMLQVNPDNRITLKDMWRHPLILKYDYLDDLGSKADEPLDIRQDFHYSPIQPNDIDLHLVRQLRSLWHMYDEDQIKQMLYDTSKNDQKLFYWLLHNYRQKQLENFLPELAQSPSDYHHLHQPVWKKRVSTCEFTRPGSQGRKRSTSKFTVISHVADTDTGTVRSYDPYNADLPMRAHSEVSHAKVVIHREGQLNRGSVRDETYTTMVSRPGSRSSAQHGRRNSQRTVTTARFNTLHSARSSMTSLQSSRIGTPYQRPASRRKRGIDFSHASKPSKQSSRAGPVYNTQGDRSEERHGKAAANVENPMAYHKSTLERIPKLNMVKAQDPRILVEQEVRTFSNSIAKDCDEAFTNSVIESEMSGLPTTVDERSSGRRSSTPFSFCTETPSVTSPTVQSAAHNYDTRPLPPLPDADMRKLRKPVPVNSEARSCTGEDQSRRRSKFLGRLAKPVLLSKQERRIVSAPVHPPDNGGVDMLPSIRENVREIEAGQIDSNRGRVVSAPPKTPHRQEDTTGLDYLARVGDTIRVVNSPTAAGQTNKTMSVRRKASHQAAGVNSATLRQEYMHGAVFGSEYISQELSPVPEAKKTISSWFRRPPREALSASEHPRKVENYRSARPSHAAEAQAKPHSPFHVSNEATSVSSAQASTKKSFGLLFWRSAKKEGVDQRMSIAGPEYEDTPSPEPARSIRLKGVIEQKRGLIESDSEVRKIEVHRNWVARLFGVKPAVSYMCLLISRKAARQTIASLFREWRQFGIRDVQVDKERNIIFARVAAKNYLDIKEVSFAAEIMTVIEHGKRGSLSIVRFTQERGAASSFYRVVNSLKMILASRDLLVTDEDKERMMIKTLNS